MNIKDIQFTRSGNWKVRVDGEIFSSHNEEKEGYESLLRARREHPDADIKLVPEFEVRENTTSFDYTEQEVEDFLKAQPDFVSGDSYATFTVDENGIKILTPFKEIII